MVGARGDALDWALALARAPGERQVLRQRPLPEGIEPLLQIAAGRQGQLLQDAMARSGEPEADLVEAVRFYLREVLFHSGADAYRLLGLAPDASAEQIKAHHRLLQQWLHPDRHTSDWDAIFAGRVNAAWNALRTPDRRAEYDAARPPSLLDATPDSAPWVAPRVLADVPLADTDTDASLRWRRRAPVLALFAACALLGVAAVRDALREPESRYGATAKENQRHAASDGGQVTLALPEATGKQTPGKVTAPARRKPARETPRIATRTAPAPLSDASVRTAPAMPTMAIRSAPLDTPPVAVPSAPALREIAMPAPLPQSVASAAALSATGSAPAPAPVRVETPSTSASIPPPQAAGAGPAVASAERVQQAQRTGRLLLAFLSARGDTLPPIWDSLAAQQRALNLRNTLQASGDTRAATPQWRIEPEDAALQATFGDSAQVRAQLVWRDQRWLVSGVALERAP